MLNIWLLYKAKCDVGERGQSMRHLQSTVWLFSGLGPPPSLSEDLGSSVWQMHLQAVPTTWGPTLHLFVAMFLVANHEHAHASVKADFAGVAGRPEAGFADPIPCKATGAVQTKPKCLRSHANDESSWNHVQDIPLITYHNPPYSWVRFTICPHMPIWYIWVNSEVYHITCCRSMTIGFKPVKYRLDHDPELLEENNGR